MHVLLLGANDYAFVLSGSHDDVQVDFLAHSQDNTVLFIVRVRIGTGDHVVPAGRQDWLHEGARFVGVVLPDGIRGRIPDFDDGGERLTLIVLYSSFQVRTRLRKHRGANNRDEEKSYGASQGHSLTSSSDSSSIVSRIPGLFRVL